MAMRVRSMGRLHADFHLAFRPRPPRDIFLQCIARTIYLNGNLPAELSSATVVDHSLVRAAFGLRAAADVHTHRDWWPSTNPAEDKAGRPLVGRTPRPLAAGRPTGYTAATRDTS